MMRRYSARQRRDRAANMNARFLPQRDDDESPALDVAGALAIMYVKDGELYLGVDLETADPAIYRMYGDQQIPLHITVQGDTVFQAAGPRSRRACRSPARAVTTPAPRIRASTDGRQRPESASAARPGDTPPCCPAALSARLEALRRPGISVTRERQEPWPMYHPCDADCWAARFAGTGRTWD
jgi:hypothetical protein